MVGTMSASYWSNSVIIKDKFHLLQTSSCHHNNRVVITIVFFLSWLFAVIIVMLRFYGSAGVILTRIGLWQSYYSCSREWRSNSGYHCCGYLGHVFATAAKWR